MSITGSKSFALKSDGTVWGWGNGIGGTPAQISGLTGVTAIAAGQDRSFALKSDGTIWAWGQNSFGALGDGTNTERHSPVQVTGLAMGVAIVSGDYHSLALLDTAPITTASPVGGVYEVASVDVTLSCDDGAGSGCNGTYYTTDGSEPTTASNVYGGTLSFSVDTTLKFFSTGLRGSPSPSTSITGPSSGVTVPRP